MQLRCVLVETAIAQLLMVEAVLDNVKGMLDHGAHLRERPLDRFRQLPQGLRQRFDDAALDSNVPGDVTLLKFRPFVSSGIASIAEEVFLLAMQQRRCLSNVGFVGGGALDCVHQARGNIDADMRLHPEVPLIALFVWCISGSRFFCLFLVEGGAAMMVASTIVPCRISRPRSPSIADTSANNACLSSCCSSQWRKFRIVVSSGTAATVRSMPAKPRKAWLSYSASSIAPSASPYHCCRKWIRSIRSRPIGGRPRSPFG